MTKNLKRNDSEEQSEQYIHSAPLDETIVLITSEAFAKNVVPCVHQQCQLTIILVYHGADETDRKWMSRYSKVRLICR